MRAAQRAGERGVPVVILDPEASLNPPGAVVLRNQPAEAIIGPVWEQGNHVVWTPPNDKEEEEKFFAIISGGGNCALLIDECSLYLKGQSASPNAMYLYRTRRHAGVDLYATSTYAADAHSIVYTVATSKFIFRNRGAYALDRLKRECQLPDPTVDLIRNLKEYEFLQF